MDKLKKILLYATLFLVFLAANQYSIQVKGAYLSIVDPLIWLCFGGWLILQLHSLLQQQSKNSLQQIIPFENLLFIVLLSLSFINATDKTAACKELFQVVEYTLSAFLIFYHIINNEKRLQLINTTLLITVGLVIIYGLCQYSNSTMTDIDVSATFGNRNTYSGFLAITLPLLLANIALGSYKPIFKGILSALMLSALTTILSGGAFLALLISLTITSCLISRKWAWITLLSLFVLIIAAFPLLPRKNFDILNKSIAVYNTSQQHPAYRYLEWQASLEMARQTPYLGVGLGNYQAQIGSHYGFLPIPEGPKEADHNNLFLVILSSTGAFGLFGLLFMLSTWFHRLYRSICQPSSQTGKIMAIAALGGLVSFCLTSIWSALLVRGVFVVLIILIASSLAPETSTEQQQKQ